jgi:hypothetical protein
LPSIARQLEDDQLTPGLVPLTARMELAFAARAAELPPATQLLLLVAALNDSESLSEVLQAGRMVADEPLGVKHSRPQLTRRSWSSMSARCAFDTR